MPRSGERCALPRVPRFYAEPMLRFLLLLAAIGCAVVAVAIGATWITSPYWPAWAAASLGLFEASFLPERVPR